MKARENVIAQRSSKKKLQKGRKPSIRTDEHDRYREEQSNLMLKIPEFQLLLQRIKSITATKSSAFKKDLILYAKLGGNENDKKFSLIHTQTTFDAPVIFDAFIDWFSTTYQIPIKLGLIFLESDAFKNTTLNFWLDTLPILKKRQTLYLLCFLTVEEFGIISKKACEQLALPVPLIGVIISDNTVSNFMIVVFDQSTNISLSTFTICFESEVPNHVIYQHLFTLLHVPEDSFIVSASSSKLASLFQIANCNLLQLGCPSLNLAKTNQLKITKMEFFKDYEKFKDDGTDGNGDGDSNDGNNGNDGDGDSNDGNSNDGDGNDSNGDGNGYGDGGDGNDAILMM